MNLGWISKKAPHKATETVGMSNNGKRVAWVTGGGTGIGESAAEHLAADGWTVVISGRRQVFRPGLADPAATAGHPGHAFPVL